MKKLKHLSWFFVVILLFILPAASCMNAEPPVLPKEDDLSQFNLQEGEISLDKNYYLVIDDSGSMSETRNSGSFSDKLEAAQWAVGEFVSKIVPSDVNLGLYALNGGQELVSLGKNNRETIIQKINQLRPRNGTPLNAAIYDATVALVTQRQKQLGYGEFYIIVATDGEATDGDMRDSVDYAIKNNILIITIGFGIHDHPLKDRSLSYREATSPEQLLEALKETQGEIDYFDSSSFTPK